ncbi:Ig-like domain-containing protein [Allomeiothermus silvanus]|uniref:Ig-like domain-containing protein n=1 Tax=Allomeiothermus silvanus TaxID=52022 RepID=UPI0023570672|nr:hypothetical protein [Allomeiothermus silvanus]MBI5811320.1 hypothetical protein [Allomeiothermus silvanus]
MKRIELLGLLLLAFVLTACPTQEQSMAPKISSFTATPASLPAGGGNVTLAWSVSNAKKLSIDPGIGEVSGSQTTVRVSQSTTFTLTATGPGGSDIKTASVNVANPPPNLPPIIDEMHIKDSNGKEVGEGQTVMNSYPLNLSVVAHDPEGDPLTYTWLACEPEWKPLVCATSGELPTYPGGRASFDPLQRGFGTWNFTLIVMDGHSATSRTRTIILK